VPDPQSYETFQRSKLDWREIDKQPHASVLDWYRQLTALRRHHPDLSDPRPGSVTVEINEAEATITLRRGRISVLVNLSSDNQGFGLASEARILMSSADVVSGEPGHIVLPPESVTVIKAT
ncbi:MAG TPA: DUF3459 domain-containing protein, partial [Acidimicrobiales bacterium]|nr:DUF3459 domain-containing protein [Acidimicrobiales bacterium]